MADNQHESDNFTEQLMALTPGDHIPFEETEQGKRELEAKPGFTGTLHSYLDWLDGMLMYGGSHTV